MSTESFIRLSCAHKVVVSLILSLFFVGFILYMVDGGLKTIFDREHICRSGPKI